MSKLNVLQLKDTRTLTPRPHGFNLSPFNCEILGSGVLQNTNTTEDFAAYLHHTAAKGLTFVRKSF